MFERVQREEWERLVAFVPPARRRWLRVTEPETAEFYLARDVAGHGDLVACGYALTPAGVVLGLFNASGEPGMGQVALRDAYARLAQRSPWLTRAARAARATVAAWWAVLAESLRVASA